MIEKRRDFFNFLLGNGKQKKTSFFPFPPYNADRSLFEKFCMECQKYCIRACDKVCQKGILRDYSGIPTVDFDIDGCKLCGECAKECPHGVLKEENKSNWNFVVSIDELRCLGYQKTMCYTCKEVCQGVLGNQKAIEFVGVFYPIINENCIGCGFCVRVCPTKAIIIKEKNV